ncbi:ArsR/SmtB family transcription factor [Paraconexibacter sp.]|uniref:ArsR/SmtB family transcription factor n=1 Tax=Paraconexibacter sp. TaxID=2949640 RepID=UPI0035690AA0
MPSDEQRPMPDLDLTAAALPPVVVERIADRFKLLSDPTRLRLVNALHVEGELSVGDLVERVGTSYGAVSKQLSLLRAQGVVSRRRDGTRIYYQICDPSLSDLCTAVCEGIRRDWAGWGAALERELTSTKEE